MENRDCVSPAATPDCPALGNGTVAAAAENSIRVLEMVVE
jgi:hypothetical protein